MDVPILSHQTYLHLLSTDVDRFGATIWVRPLDLSIFNLFSEEGNATMPYEVENPLTVHIGKRWKVNDMISMAYYTFPNNGNRISFGSTAKIRLQIVSKPNCIVVNREHIVTENDKHYVWINQNNHAIKREITTGLDNQLEFEVTSGLEPGEQLITEGISLLTDNALIRVVE